MIDVEKPTTQEAVSAYLATNHIFLGLMKEIRELSKKKPDAILSAGKVKIVNRVLTDLKKFLDPEPEGKFLDLLDDSDLPQTSDAVLVMVQFESALNSFRERYHKSYKTDGFSTKSAWITPEFLETCEEDWEY